MNAWGAQVMADELTESGDQAVKWFLYTGCVPPAIPYTLNLKPKPKSHPKPKPQPQVHLEQLQNLVTGESTLKMVRSAPTTDEIRPGTTYINPPKQPQIRK